MSDAAVEQLARDAGVLVEWEDAAGRPRMVAPDTLRTVLSALGLPAGNPGQVRESQNELIRRRREAAGSFLTAAAGQPFVLPARREARTAQVRLETGEVRDLPLRNGQATIDTPGYHRIEVQGCALTVAVAPSRAVTIEEAVPGRRPWGAAIQLYALRGRRPKPFGDFGDLAEFAEAAAARGADAVAISPVHALFAADPSRYGPYGPSTRLFLNPAYADPAAVFGDSAALKERAGGDLIDWPAAIPGRLAALRALFEAFHAAADSPERQAFQSFRRAGGEDLEGHARFEALHARFFAESGAGGWPDWPQPYQHARGPAAARFASENADEVTFHVFLQWLADRSLERAQARARSAGMALGLVTDVAVGMDPGGSHAWSRPDDLLKSLSVGAPPDLFQARGQDWGLAAFSPQALAATSYAAFLSTLRSAMRHAGGVRIDHAMGLGRLWLVPHGAAPTEGAYLAYPLDDLLRLIALESHRARAVVVGEDLGTVPPGFRDALDGRGVMGMRVLWFERTEDGGFTPPGEWGEQAAAMTSTHDLPTVAGWWRGRDIEWRSRISRDQTAAAVERAEREAHRTKLWAACVAEGCAEGPEPSADASGRAVDAAVAFAGQADCSLALLPLEDLLGLEEQPNLPGTTDEHPNWRRRLETDAETLLSRPDVAARLRTLNARRSP